jgi:hypothetical protein
MMRVSVLVTTLALLLVASDAVLTQGDGGQARGARQAGQRQGGQGQGGQGQGGAGARAQGAGPLGRAGGGRGLAGRGRGGDMPPGTSAIQGRVLAADTGGPVRRAQVRAQSNVGRGAQLVTTDGDGRFELRDLPAGRWLVSVSKGGYISQQFGQREPFDAPTPIELAEGQRVSADFSLSRGGVVTGQIFDEFGDPITGARVQVLRSQMRQGRRQLTPAGTSGQTDDTGAYRIFGLAPGDYYVAGNLRAAPIESPEGAVTYAPTYYPGTGMMSEAQRVQVRAGSEQSSLNFVLLPVRAVRVSGTIVSSSGEPMQAVANLLPAGGLEEGAALANAGRADAAGTFTITNVVPGSYVLNVTGRRGAAGAETEMASVPINVGDSDLAGVTVVTSRGASVRGTVAFEGASKPAAVTGMRVTAQPLRPGPSGAQPGIVSDAGTFELAGLMGPYAIRMDRLPQGWTVRSMTANGADAADHPVDFRGSDQIAMRIVLTDRITEITGTVTSGDKPVDGHVIVFADDPAKWAFPSRYIQSVRASKDGTFAVRALPGGQRYLIAAVASMAQGNQQDPEFLERLKAGATRLSLAEGEKKAVAVEIPGR